MRVIIIGAGGHAQVVADALLCMGVAVAGFADPNGGMAAGAFGIPLIGSDEAVASVPHDALVIGIGDNRLRQQIFERFLGQGERFATVRHPAATISRDVSVGEGTVIFAGVVVNTGSRIGANAILNTGCTIDHHTTVVDHAHVAPGAHVAGMVTLGEGALVGVGAAITPGRQVGAWATVGAGAAVVRDVPAHVTVVGVPARARSTNPWTVESL